MIKKILIIFLIMNLIFSPMLLLNGEERGRKWNYYDRTYALTTATTTLSFEKEAMFVYIRNYAASSGNAYISFDTRDFMGNSYSRTPISTHLGTASVEIPAGYIFSTNDLKATGIKMISNTTATVEVFYITEQ